MSRDRLSQIEKNLATLYKQKAALEQEALLYTGLPKIRADQQIEQELQPKIQQYEQERQQVLNEIAAQLVISELEAEQVIGEIVQGVTQIQSQPLTADSDTILQILLEIRDKLNQPGPSAAAKLKGVISSIPPFVGISYETEIDTENFFRTHFPTFTRLLKDAAKK